MLRQSGVAANRLLCGGSSMLQASSSSQQGAASGSKLIFNAALFSSRAAPEGSAATQAAAGTPAVQEAAHYSAAAAAALAAKRQGLIGSGISLKPSTMPFGTRGLATSSSAAAPAAAAAAKEQPSDKYAGLKKFVKVAAAVAAALGLTASPALADAPQAWQILPQDTASSTAQAQVDLHHDITFFLIAILTSVFYMFFHIATKFHYSRVLKPEKLTHHTTAEVIWTVIPTFVVVMIAIPSLTLIYSLDQHTEKPGLTVKIIGRQWYWSYEMHDHLQHKLLDPDRLVSIAEKALDK